MAENSRKREKDRSVNAAKKGKAAPKKAATVSERAKQAKKDSK